MNAPAINKNHPPVGIDLGTTYSVVAFLDETGRSETILNDTGDTMTPSCILFDDDLVVVGLALSAMLIHTHPDIVRSHWPGQGDALEAIQRVTNWLERRVVGHELKRWLGSWRL